MTRSRNTLPSGWIAGRVERARSASTTAASDLVVDDDRRARAARGLGVVGRDHGHRLARVAHDVAGEHRLVAVLEPVAVHRDVGGGDHRVHAGDRQRGRRCRSTGCAPTDAASAAPGPTACPRPTGRRRTRTRRATLAMPSGRIARCADPARGARCRCRRSSVATRRRASARRPSHGLEDPAVAGAAAQVARDRLADRRARSGSGSRSSRSCTAMTSPGVQNPHCTAPVSTNACCTSVIARASVRLQPLDGDDLGADRRGREHQARAHQRPVDQHRARAALALLAARLGARQAEALAQHVEQALAEPRVGDLVVVAVDAQRVRSSRHAMRTSGRSARRGEHARPRGAGTSAVQR